MSVPWLHAPGTLARHHLFLHPQRLLCSLGKDHSDVTSEFASEFHCEFEAKALSSVLEAHITFLDLTDAKAILLTYQSVECVILASDEHLKSSTPQRT